MPRSGNKKGSSQTPAAGKKPANGSSSSPSASKKSPAVVVRKNPTASAPAKTPPSKNSKSSSSSPKAPPTPTIVKDKSSPPKVAATPQSAKAKKNTSSSIGKQQQSSSSTSRKSTPTPVSKGGKKPTPPFSLKGNKKAGEVAVRQSTTPQVTTGPPSRQQPATPSHQHPTVGVAAVLPSEDVTTTKSLSGGNATTTASKVGKVAANIEKDSTMTKISKLAHKSASTTSSTTKTPAAAATALTSKTTTNTGCGHKATTKVAPVVAEPNTAATSTTIPKKAPIHVPVAPSPLTIMRGLIFYLYAPCTDCSSTQTPFCPTTGSPHAPNDYCHDCGLLTKYCPNTGLEHNPIHRPILPILHGTATATDATTAATSSSTTKNKKPPSASLSLTTATTTLHPPPHFSKANAAEEDDEDDDSKPLLSLAAVTSSSSPSKTNSVKAAEGKLSKAKKQQPTTTATVDDTQSQASKEEAVAVTTEALDFQFPPLGATQCCCCRHLCVDEIPAFNINHKENDNSKASTRLGIHSLSVQVGGPQGHQKNVSSSPTVSQLPPSTLRSVGMWKALIVRLAGPLPPKQRMAIQHSITSKQYHHQLSKEQLTSTLQTLLLQPQQEDRNSIKSGICWKDVRTFMDDNRELITSTIQYLFTPPHQSTATNKKANAAETTFALLRPKTTSTKLNDKNNKTKTAVSSSPSVASSVGLTYPLEEGKMINEDSDLVGLLTQLCANAVVVPTPGGVKGTEEYNRTVSELFDEYVYHLSAGTSSSTGIPPTSAPPSKQQSHNHKGSVGNAFWSASFIGKSRPESALVALLHNTATGLSSVRCVKCRSSYHPVCYLRSTGILPTLTASDRNSVASTNSSTGTTMDASSSSANVGSLLLLSQMTQSAQSTQPLNSQQSQHLLPSSSSSFAAAESGLISSLLSNSMMNSTDTMTQILGDSQSQNYNYTLENGNNAAGGISSSSPADYSVIRCLVGWHLYIIHTLAVPIIRNLVAPTRSVPPSLSQKTGKNSSCEEGACDGVEDYPTRAFSLPMEDDDDDEQEEASKIEPQSKLATPNSAAEEEEKCGGERRQQHELFLAALDGLESRIIASIGNHNDESEECGTILDKLSTSLLPPALHEIIPCQMCLSQLVATQHNDETVDASIPYPTQTSSSSIQIDKIICSDEIVVAIQTDAGIPPVHPSIPTTKQQLKSGKGSKTTLTTSQADLLVAKLLINGFATTPIESEKKKGTNQKRGAATRPPVEEVLEGLRSKMCRCYDELVTQFSVEEALGQSKDAVARRDAIIKAILDRLDQIPNNNNSIKRSHDGVGGVEDSSDGMLTQHLILTSDEQLAFRNEEMALRKKLRAARRIDTAPPASLQTGYANFRARGPGRYEIVEDFVEATVIPLINNSAPLQQALDSLLSLHWGDLVGATIPQKHPQVPSPHADDEDENPFTQPRSQYPQQQLDGSDIISLSYIEATGIKNNSTAENGEEEEDESVPQQTGKFRQLSSGCFYATTEALPQNWHSDGPVLIEDVCENVTRNIPVSIEGSASSETEKHQQQYMREALRTPSLAPYALNVFVPLVPVDRSNGTEFRPMSHLTVSARMEVRAAMSKYPSFNAAAFDKLILSNNPSSYPISSATKKVVGGSGGSSPLSQQDPSSVFTTTASSSSCYVPPAVAYQVNASHTVAPTCPVGSALIFDYRVFHRGLGNKASVDRPCVYISYGRPWYRDTYNFSNTRYANRLLLPDGWEVSLTEQRANRRLKRQRARDEEEEEMEEDDEEGDDDEENSDVFK